MRHIGTIKQVQIQRASLKKGERPHRIYDPAPLLVVDQIWLAPEGVLGQLHDGSWTVDVHNLRHPQSRHSGTNPISFGFTRYYADMRTRFGDHLSHGCAGENILIDSDEGYTLAELGQRVAIQSATAGTITYLDAVRVAVPCVEFSHYVNRADLVSNPLPADVLKSTLQFLDEGRRGFYASVTESGIIRSGDAIYIVD